MEMMLRSGVPEAQWKQDKIYLSFLYLAEWALVGHDGARNGNLRESQ
jgi:hypothetical protein